MAAGISHVSTKSWAEWHTRCHEWAQATKLFPSVFIDLLESSWPVKFLQHKVDGCESGLVASLIFEEKQSFSSESQVLHDLETFFYKADFR